MPLCFFIFTQQSISNQYSIMETPGKRKHTNLDYGKTQENVLFSMLYPKLGQQELENHFTTRWNIEAMWGILNLLIKSI